MSVGLRTWSTAEELARISSFVFRLESIGSALVGSSDVFCDGSVGPEGTGDSFLSGDIELIQSEDLLPLRLGGFDPNCRPVVDTRVSEDEVALVGFQLKRLHLSRKSAIFSKLSIPKRYSARKSRKSSLFLDDG